ncbi:MAG TPA: VIT1/CCC1 transporter family protein [Steroidobacteraceae bacterium]|jgi:VIT1/CCC1 family predicted Fe2+/Mn2+ transporter
MATHPQSPRIGSSRAVDLARMRRNFLAEQESGVLYEALAAIARDPQQKRAYLELAASERQHVRFWAERLHAAGETTPPRHRPSPRTRVLILLARSFGTRSVVPTITARELEDRAGYDCQPDAAEAGLAASEQSHAERLRAMGGVTVGTKLRAAVLGANDGLASNLCLLMGVVGGGARTSAILLAGVAGLVGGALSMALGEWLSVTNAREFAASLMDREAGALHRTFPTRREDPAAGEAGSAARFSFGLFALGALVPLLPFTFLSGVPAIVGSIAASVIALLVIGVATSLFNGRSPAFAALRQVVIGALAAAVTYAAGWLFEAIVS